ncbi:MAG: ImmA/IrrE family metallo-endopeptidase [Candidatus Omnitrophota bacterium]|nr:ImmA/IrrE family metallo-endopeptidase [Candidatus Omnitrophota bacterium]
MQFAPIIKTAEQINCDAESFLSTYHPSLFIPIPIEEIIELQMKMDIISIPGLKDSFAKMGLEIDAFISSDLKSISVDRYIYENRLNRYRFSLAHEIGHKILHEYLYAQFKFNVRDQWIKVLNQIPISERQIVEWQADEFAGLILVPRLVLKNEYGKAIKEAETIVKKSFEDNPSLVENVVIEYFLTGKFNVSKYVIRRRLENDHLI